MSHRIENIKAGGDVYVVINDNQTKRDRSPDSNSSSSTVSEYEIKRRRKITYFNGEGQKEWIPQHELIYEGVNITSKLKRFRERNISLAVKEQNLSNLRILSLSFIFPINTVDKSKCVSTYLSLKGKTAIEEFSAKKYKQESTKVLDEAILFCHKASTATDINSIAFEEKSAIDKIIKSLCSYFRNKHAHIKSASEASFMNQFVMPIISEILLNNADETTIYATIDSPEKNKKKPDLMLGYEDRKKQVFFFFVEMKRMNTTSKYQAEDDFVKLMKQQKLSVDTQLGLGVRSPVSYGLLCEGFRCSMFKMTLMEDGIYMPIMVRRFSLVEEFADIINIPAIVESLVIVKDELELLKKKIQKCRQVDRDHQKKLIRPSFITKFK